MKFRDKLAEIDSQIVSLKKKRKALISHRHKSCKHPISQIIQGKWRDNEWLHPDPEFRVCKICGYAEEGWGCGFWNLAPNNYNIPEVSREEARKHVLVFLTRHQMNKLRFPK
jgi:hypothetical protein